jgi:hypothetical protein
VFDLEQLGTQVLLVNLQSNPWTIDIIDLVAEEHLFAVSKKPSLI